MRYVNQLFTYLYVYFFAMFLTQKFNTESCNSAHSKTRTLLAYCVCACANCMERDAGRDMCAAKTDRVTNLLAAWLRRIQADQSETGADCQTACWEGRLLQPLSASTNNQAKFADRWINRRRTTINLWLGPCLSIARCHQAGPASDVRSRPVRRPVSIQRPFAYGAPPASKSSHTDYLFCGRKDLAAPFPDDGPPRIKNPPAAHPPTTTGRPFAAVGLPSCLYQLCLQRLTKAYSKRRTLSTVPQNVHEKSHLLFSAAACPTLQLHFISLKKFLWLSNIRIRLQFTVIFVMYVILNNFSADHCSDKPSQRLQSTHGVAHEVNGSFLKFLYKNRQFGKASLWDDICV